MKNEECHQILKEAAECLRYEGKQISTKIDGLKDQINDQSDRISSLEHSVKELLLELHKFSSNKNLAIEREQM